MKALLLTLLLPLSGSAAPFSGKFTGAGQAVMRETRKCSEIFLRLESSPNELKVLDGGYNCEDLDASFDPFTLEVKEGRIFSEGKAVSHWRLELLNGALHYREEWVSGGKPALTVTGTLNRRP